MHTLIECWACGAQWADDGLEECPACRTVVDLSVYRPKPCLAGKYDKATFSDIPFGVSPTGDRKNS